MEAIITEIKARGNLLLNLNNRLIPPDAPIWQKDVDKAVDGTEAAMFPAAFPLDNLDAAGLDVTVLFPGGETGGDYTLGLLYNNDIVLFSGKAQPGRSKSQPDDKPGNAESGEQNTCCFTLASQHRPRGFFRVQGIKLSWRLVNENTGETLELPPLRFEFYWLYSDSIDLFWRGVPVEWLRDFTYHLEGEGLPNHDHDGPTCHAPEKIMASVVTWLFNRTPPLYDIAHGSPHFTRVCGRLEFSLFLAQYLFAINDSDDCCNCYDMANIVQAFLHLLGIKDVAYAFMSPFGYLKKTQLIGRGECNNPIYDSGESGPLVDECAEARKPFSNHAFCITSGGGKVLDACTGPHTGVEVKNQYLENAIDPVHFEVPGYRAGTVENIQEGKGVVIIDLTVAPKKLTVLPFTKAFMKELRISVNRFSKRRNKYVVFSWPDPFHCPALSDQHLSLFYTGLIHGQGEVIKTWKLKQEDNGKSIIINVHIFSGSKTSALYRFIELGSAGSAAELRYGKGDPGLGHYSAQSIAPGINRRYFWVYYNMIVDIVNHNSDAEVDAVNKWYRQQAKAHLKKRIDADLPSVDHILCDNLAPKVGETVTVSMNLLPNISHDFIIKGQGLRLQEEEPGKLVFRARRKGAVKLGILAVDKNTLLMKTKEFDLKVQ
ncbi:MAG: hypothetical protein QG657_3519 [Acidobacteriota bacterium]|nr:hypothetical protein [Acidobacteriota bacterium]